MSKKNEKVSACCKVISAKILFLFNIGLVPTVSHEMYIIFIHRRSYV